MFLSGLFAIVMLCGIIWWYLQVPSRGVHSSGFVPLASAQRQYLREIEELGFRFDRSPDRKLLTVPPGWCILGYAIYDDSRRLRGSWISGEFRLRTRFVVGEGYVDSKPVYKVIDRFGGGYIFAFPPYGTASEAECRSWLDTIYPEWENPTKYWD